MQKTNKTKLFQTAYVLFSVLCDVAVAILAAIISENNCTCIACLAVLFSGAVCSFHALSVLFELISGRCILSRTAKTFKFSASVILAVSALAKHFSLPYTMLYEHQYCMDYASLPTDTVFYLSAFAVIVSFLVFDKKHRLPMSFIHLAMIPCFLAVFEKLFLQCKDISLIVVFSFVLSAYAISFVFSVINGNRLNAIFSLIKLALGK